MYTHAQQQHTHMQTHTNTLLHLQIKNKFDRVSSKYNGYIQRVLNNKNILKRNTKNSLNIIFKLAKFEKY